MSLAFLLTFSKYVALYFFFCPSKTVLHSRQLHRLPQVSLSFYSHQTNPLLSHLLIVELCMQNCQTSLISFFLLFFCQSALSPHYVALASTKRSFFAPAHLSFSDCPFSYASLLLFQSFRFSRQITQKQNWPFLQMSCRQKSWLSSLKIPDIAYLLSERTSLNKNYLKFRRLSKVYVAWKIR